MASPSTRITRLLFAGGRVASRDIAEEIADGLLRLADLADRAGPADLARLAAKLRATAEEARRIRHPSQKKQ